MIPITDHTEQGFETASVLLRYGVAVGAAALATLLTLLLRPLIHTSFFPLFSLAVFVSAWVGGLGPGLLTTALAGLANAYFFLSPSYSFAVTVDGLIKLSVFTLVAVLISLLTDQRRRAEEAQVHLMAELRRVNAELQQFAHIVSHDLNEPLRTISNYVKLLARRYQGKLDTNADEYIALAVDGAQHMQGLITDLLAYTRVDGRAQEFTAVDGEALLARVLTDLQMAIADAKAEITHDPLPTVYGDEARLDQVLQNLIGNALKFRGEAAPHIHVSSQRDGIHWRFAVLDNGIGIDPTQTGRLFQVFQRLHTRQEYAGTGIGLAICKKIVEQHGGRIWVESRPGEGSIFYFTISEKSSQESAFRSQENKTVGHRERKGMETLKPTA